MPSNGEWRHIKIINTPSRAKEISGGIKNALDRGESLAKAKQSFINAGYTPQEVQESTQMIKSVPLQNTKPLIPTKPIPPKKTLSKKTIIILAIVGAIILITALVLGIFWKKIF